MDNEPVPAVSQKQLFKQKQIKDFITAYNIHCQKAHPSLFKTLDLVKKIQQFIFDTTLTQRQVQVNQIGQNLSQCLKAAKTNKKNGILIIGPPGIGKTAFMKYYSEINSKILINASCCCLLSTFKQQAQQVLDLVFEMANFSSNTILFFDQIDLFLNNQNNFQKIQEVRKSLIKNLSNAQYTAPVVFSTNKPWKIHNKAFYDNIYEVIQIPISSYQKRKNLIEMILKDCESQNLDTKIIDPEDVAQKTINYLNSDIYVLVRQIMMEPLRQMVENGKTAADIQKQNFVITQHHIDMAYKKIRPSILVEQIDEYKKWQEKFQQGLE